MGSRWCGITSGGHGTGSRKWACACAPVMRITGGPCCVPKNGFVSEKMRTESWQGPRPCEFSLERSKPSSKRRICHHTLYSTTEARQPVEGTMNTVLPLTCKWRPRRGETAFRVGIASVLQMGPSCFKCASLDPFLLGRVRAT